MSLASEILTRAASTLPAGVTRRLDSWVNTITGLGGARDRTRGARVANFVPLTLYELDALYHGEDLPRKIVDALPSEALRVGWSCDDGGDLDRAIRRWKAPQSLLDAWVWGRLYGRGAILIGTTDRLGAMDQPLDVSRLQPGDLAYLEVLDGLDLSVADYFEDSRNPNFGDPRTYYVNGTGNPGTLGSARVAANARVHASRLILFGGARTSARQRARNQGRDLSVLQACADVLRDVDQSWRSVMVLMQDLSQAVFKIDGLIQLIADGRSDVILDRMQVVDMARSVARAVVVDAEHESYEHTGAANVTGVDPLLVRAFQRLAAAADMPLTVLMGVSPAGLNATGESDLRIWYAAADRAREDIEPQVYRLSYIIARCEGLDWSGEIEWPSLYAQTEKEAAEVAKLEADTDAVRIQSGTLTAAEASLIRWGGLTPAEVVDLAALEREVDPTSAADTGPEIVPGEVWIDTATGRRLTVTGRARGRVLFTGKDPEYPDRQYAWAEKTFLERCRREKDLAALVAKNPAPVPAPGPAPAPAPAGGAAFKVGDRVVVDPAKAHTPGASGPGVVREVNGTALAIEFDSMPGEVHRWYTASEVSPEGA